MDYASNDLFISPKDACAHLSARHVTRLVKTSSSNDALQSFGGNDKSFEAYIGIVGIIDEKRI